MSGDGTFSLDRLARVTWGAIAEPGDAVAHALVEVLGAAEALEWARRARLDPVGSSIDLGESAGSELVDRAVGAIERWSLREAAWDPSPHLERAGRVGARFIVPGDTEWPVEMDDLAGAAPFGLWVRGAVSPRDAWGRGIAVVGSRSSTAYGEYVAASIAAGLADEGWAVISGGAFGIDARAHRASLAADGVTVAVMAGGVDRLYPEGNADLLRRVVEVGAVVSELPPGYAPHRHRFLTRNRVIAAARATVVVEAAFRSGALSTAARAEEIGRPVAAVPGPVTSAASGGCHRLIREGGVLVSSATEVLELVEPLDATRPPTPEAPGSASRVTRMAPNFSAAHHRQAYDAISLRGSTVGEIATSSGLGIVETRSALGALLLSGLAARDGVLWRRLPPFR